MKPKEMIQLFVALVVLIGAGLVIYGQVGPKNTSSNSKGVVVEKITPIPASFDRDGLNKLSDNTLVKDFYVKPDLKSGVGNPKPFGPLQ